MTLTQTTFLGSSIRGWNATIGWNNQSSTLSVSLVSDPVNGDVFSPVSPGTPVYFEYEGFAFGGLLQSYKTLNSPAGYPVYEVSVIDPRELLNGVQLIIDSYTGDTTSIPNLYNIYGYWENTSFGSSDTNSSGMPWRKIVDGINGIQLFNPIQFRNYAFIVDLTELPSLPDYYRVGGGVSLSMMDFVSRICEDGGCDFFFELRFVSGYNLIKLRTISRATQPVLGNISNFIAQNTAGTAVTSDYGEELRNETTSKFLVGGRIAKIFVQTQTDSLEDVLYDDTIMQFWGLNEDSTPVIGVVDEDEENEDRLTNYSFSLPSRYVNIVGVGETYNTDVMEMRAALGGQAGWETYLWSQNSVEDSSHENKANKIGLMSNLRDDIVDVLKNEFNSEDKFRNLDLRIFAPLNGRLLTRQSDVVNSVEERIKSLYDYVANYANEYYGRKFMVRIPFVFADIESETNIIKTSVQPCEGGFLEESAWAQAINNNLLPGNINALTFEDGRIYTYVRFDDAETLNFADIPPENIILEVKQGEDGPRYFAFIKCEVEPNIYFLNNTTLFSPRVVVVLPGRVVPLEDDGNDYAGILKTIFTKHARDNLEIDNQDTINEIIKNIFGRFGSEQLLFGLSGLAVTPNLVGVALQSNIESYGPWYSLGAVGKLEFEYDESLVPWNYGGYEVLNLVGNARVSEAITSQQSSETGAIEVAGVPTLNLGAQLINGGPYVSNITLQISTEAITTTYRMETWTPRFGKLTKTNIDRMAKLGRDAQLQRRALRHLAQVPPPGSKFFKSRENFFANAINRQKSSSTIGYIGGELITTEDITKAASVLLPSYHLAQQVYENYHSKGLMSIDGLVRPFSVTPDNEYLSSYETPLASGDSGRSVTELNPFATGNDIGLIIGNSGIDNIEGHVNEITTNLRPMALRGPLVVTGWGYDTNNKPVPNSDEDNPNSNFISGHLHRSQLWKTGPVDLQWDNSRKVWVGGGVGKIRVAKLINNLTGGSFASGYLLRPNIVNGNISSWSESGLVRIYDGFEFTHPITPSGARVYIAKEETCNEYFTIAAGIY